ncbi:MULTISPECIES: DUF47 domain-containing protein [unclassified Haladaptatus]|uniref:DUF47 domain-containing protein n=1 Tax=unclassified Haladaptatus TaxID=2622732 RepID=UPI0023E8B26E|nr:MULTISPECIES: DUF47 family protein [unclassified Haladaptatus]
MSTQETADLPTAVVETTGIFMDGIRECVTCLETTLDAYPDDWDRVRDSVLRLSAREAQCDRTGRRVQTLVGRRQSPNFTGLYLRADDFVEYVDDVDRIANHAERFANELLAIQPDIPDVVHEGLREMAELTVEATVALVNATTHYVESLCNPTLNPTLPTVEEDIRTLEVTCDEKQYDLLSTIFDPGASVNALVLRELLFALDDVTNAVEDALDQLLYMSTSQV